MTKKRTTIYLDKDSQKIIDIIKLKLNINQTDVIKIALENYFYSETYKNEVNKRLFLKERG